MIQAEYYWFTLFVFGLICAGLFIFRRLFYNPGSARKEKSEEENTREREKEERLFRLYQNMEEMMDNFEGYIEDTRTEINAGKAAMLRQAEQVNDMCKRAVEAEAGVQAMVTMVRAEKAAFKKEEKPVVEAPPPVAEPARRSSRQESVKELLGRGNTVEQIAQKLDISINEVRLIVYGLMTKGVEQK